MKRKRSRDRSKRNEVVSAYPHVKVPDGMYARMYPSAVMAGSEGLTWASSLASADRARAAACRRDPGVTRAPGPQGTPTGLPFLQRCALRLC